MAEIVKEGKKIAVKYAVMLVLLLVAMTGAMDTIMREYFADSYSSGFVAIPVYFLIIGALVLALVSNSIDDAKKYTRMYLLTRTIKILSFIVFCVVCGLVISGSVKAFIVTSMIFAVVYMVFETIVLFKFNKEVHEIQQNNQK